MHTIQQLLGVNKYSGLRYQAAQNRALDRVLREIGGLPLTEGNLQHKLVGWFNAVVGEELQKLPSFPEDLQTSPFFTDLLDSHFLTQLNPSLEEDNRYVPESFERDCSAFAQTSDKKPPEPWTHDPNNDPDTLNDAA